MNARTISYELHNTEQTLKQSQVVGALRFWMALLGVAICRAGFALDTYHIGNSLTYDSQPWAVSWMLDTRLGGQSRYGYQVASGRSLQEHWDGPYANGATTGGGFGHYPDAFEEHAWDAVVLQTHPKGPEGTTFGMEIDRIIDFVELVDAGPSESPTIIVYGTWPGIAESKWDSWDAPFDGERESLAAYSEAYHNALYDAVAEVYPGRVRLASAGKVFHEIRQRAEAGDAPFTVADEHEDDPLYRDAIHMNRELGGFIASTAVQTVLSQHSMVGVAPSSRVIWWDEDDLSREHAAWSQLVAWEVLSADPRAGVLPPAQGDYNGDGAIDAADHDVWRDRFGSTERLIADANGDGIVNAADYTAWRDSSLPGATTAIPEPGAGVVLLTLAFGVALRVRR